MRVRRNILYEVVSLLGEARTIRGKSHKVRRMSGLFNISVSKRAVIGDFALSRGKVRKARRKVVLR